jgi:hypothetical protein
MSTNTIAKPEDFKRAVAALNVERVVLPVSGLAVLLCRPPIFAALRLGREGTELQTKITEAKPEEIRSEDITAFSDWLTATLSRLFVQPRFSGAPTSHEIGLGDILVDDLKYIFRWLRGEVFSQELEVRSEKLGENPSSYSLLASSSCTEDLAPFPGGPRAASVSGGGGETQPVPAEPVTGAQGDASLLAGLRRG